MLPATTPRSSVAHEHRAVKTRIAHLPLLLLLPAGCRNENVPAGSGGPTHPPSPCWSATTSEDQPEQFYPCAEHDYRCVAGRIVDGVIQLKTRFPQLCGLDRACISDGPDYKLNDELQMTEPAFHTQLWFEHGVSYVPNPKYQPGKKSMKELPVYDPDEGVRINLSLFLGPLISQVRFVEERIGELGVVNRSNSPDRELLQAVWDVIDRERERYQETHDGIVPSGTQPRDGEINAAQASRF